MVDVRWRPLAVVVVGAVLVWADCIYAQSAAKRPPSTGQQIEDLLAQKAQRTSAQRKVSSQLLDAAASAPGGRRRRAPAGSRLLTPETSSVTGRHPGGCHEGGAGPHPRPGRHGHQQRSQVSGHPGGTPGDCYRAAGEAGGGADNPSRRRGGDPQGQHDPGRCRPPGEYGAHELTASMARVSGSG